MNWPECDKCGSSTCCGGCKEFEDEDPPCECIQVDADEWNARWCPAHGPGSPADKRNRAAEAETEAKFWEGIKPWWNEAEDDPRCVMCGFQLHSHGKYSQICPVLVRGMLHQFRKEETR